MRWLALGGLVGPLLFAAAVVVCAALRPDYSHLHHFISELGADETPNSWLMNFGGFVAGGISLVGFAVALRALLPSRRTITVGAVLLVVFGLGVALSGIYSCDAGCPIDGRSSEAVVHDQLALVTFISGIFATLVLGLSFRSLDSLRPLWLYTVASGVLAFVFLAALVSTIETKELTGLWQRLMLTALFGWCAVMGLRLFSTAAPDSRASGRSFS